MIIVVAGTVPIQADKRNEAAAAMLEMAAKTQKEPGCISYRFFFSIENPNEVLVFEEWETAEALAAHFQTDHMAAFNKKLPSLAAGPGDIKRYVVDSVTPL